MVESGVIDAIDLGNHESRDGLIAHAVVGQGDAHQRANAGDAKRIARIVQEEVIKEGRANEVRGIAHSTPATGCMSGVRSALGTIR